MRKQERKYVAAPGAPFAAEDVGLIAARLEKLAAESTGGQLKPETVVEDARQEESVLHNCFDWDDTVAADKWRLSTARAIVNHVMVSVESNTGEASLVHAFSSVQVVYPSEVEGEEPTTVRGYVTLDRVLSDPDVFDAVLEDCIRELRGIQKKYAGYKALKPVWQAVEKVVRKHNGKAQHVPAMA